MEWLNSNAGILIVVFSVLIIALCALCAWLLFSLHQKIAVQKLKFTGFYSVGKDNRRRYASLTIGNKSLNHLVLAELGVQNGKMNIALTDVYKEQNGISDEACVVVEQRSAISFKLYCSDLKKLVIEQKGKNILKKLRLYAVDMTGTVYRGKIPAVRKLIKELLAAEKAGVLFDAHESSEDKSSETEN